MLVIAVTLRDDVFQILSIAVREYGLQLHYNPFSVRIYNGKNREYTIYIQFNLSEKKNKSVKLLFSCTGSENEAR